MTEHFVLRLDDIQPSQLYVSARKLAEVLGRIDAARPATVEPFPVKRLGDELVLTDGHTRAFAAFLCGLAEVRAYWDEDDLDWEAYEICVQWCRAEGIRSIGDLVGRVVGPRDYQGKWLDRCAEMHRELSAKRDSG